jgi:hypothetical protein
MGMFSSERAVTFKLANGTEASALVDHRDVRPSKITPGSVVDGQLKVSVLQVTKDSALIDLPQSGIVQGPRIRVPIDLLKK